MVLIDFTNAIPILQAHGYWVLLLATILEGPISTAAGAFAASLDILNIYLVILISFLGDLIGDSIYFFIGRYSRKPIIERYGGRVGITPARLVSIEGQLKKHFFKTLVLLKLTPLLAPPGLMLVGASKVSYKKFILSSLIIIIPTSLIFAALGFYIGAASFQFIKYYKLAREILFVIVIIVIVIAYLLEKKGMKKITDKIGNKI